MPPSIGMTLLHEDITERIIKIFYAVYNELGYGFLEKVCQRAMVIALIEAGLGVEENVRFEVWFRGQLIGEFIADVVVNRVVLVEIKANSTFHAWDEAQALNYLRVSQLEVALLMNFGPKPEYRRRIFTNDRKSALPSLGLPREATDDTDATIKEIKKG